MDNVYEHRLSGWKKRGQGCFGKVHFHVQGSGQECPLYTICGGMCESPLPLPKVGDRSVRSTLSAAGCSSEDEVPERKIDAAGVSFSATFSMT